MLRYGLLSGGADRRLLPTFGLASAAGGLAGSVLQEWAGSPRLSLVFGTLLIVAAAGEATGLVGRVRIGGHL